MFPIPEAFAFPDAGIDRAITLTQPWATLMAFKFKVIETRGRLSNYRGWFGIHAAKGFPEGCKALCLEKPFEETLIKCGIVRVNDLPLGEVLAVTCLTGCEQASYLSQHVAGTLEDAFGDFGFGRYGLLTDGVRRVRNPVPMRGFQSIPWKMPHVIMMEDLL